MIKSVNLSLSLCLSLCLSNWVMIKKTCVNVLLIRLVSTGIRFVTNFANYNNVIFIRQGVQLYSISNTTSPHLSVIFTFSASGMKMTMVLSYTAMIYLSTGIYLRMLEIGRYEKSYRGLNLEDV